MDVFLRPATSDDMVIIQRTLYRTLTWDGVSEGMTFERAMEHEDVAQYRRGWGCTGDVRNIN